MSITRSPKSRLAALLTAGALSVGTIAAPTAAAQPPVVTGGLVNVTIVDFADVNVEDVVVQIPVSAAANVCDVSVAALLAQINEFGEANCTATSAANANAPR